jgi:GH24 family phage-related lysozyme (muramidase)
LSSHKYSLFTEKGYQLTKKYTIPRTYLGMGKYAAYKNFGESDWKIGYGSKTINDHSLSASDKASQEEIDKQFYEDLQFFSKQAEKYVFVNLNKNKRAALLSFAHSVGLCSFKSCRLLDLINSYASKNKIIKEWSPYINRIWMSGGDFMTSRRRTELDMYFAPDKEIPTFYPHKCSTEVCLLNIAETYNGTATQIKGIEYLEKKIKEFDPSGEILRQFFRYWNKTPSGLGSPSRRGVVP